MESGLLANHRYVTVRVGRVRCEAKIVGGVQSVLMKKPADQASQPLSHFNKINKTKKDQNPCMSC